VSYRQYFSINSYIIFEKPSREILDGLTGCANCVPMSNGAGCVFNRVGYGDCALGKIRCYIGKSDIIGCVNLCCGTFKIKQTTY
jgi:hypothetical protein